MRDLPNVTQWQSVPGLGAPGSEPCITAGICTSLNLCIAARETLSLSPLTLKGPPAQEVDTGSGLLAEGSIPHGAQMGVTQAPAMRNVRLAGLPRGFVLVPPCLAPSGARGELQLVTPGWGRVCVLLAQRGSQPALGALLFE